MKFLLLFCHDGLDVFDGARHGRREVLCAGRRDKAVILHTEADAEIFGVNADMILNDVGAQWDGECNDVSRGWPCNGKYSKEQRMLYECALNTSNYMYLPISS